MPRSKPDASTGSRSLRLDLRVSPEELAAIQIAADQSGVYRDSWARGVLLLEVAKLQRKRALRKKT
jgi:hypothetical protein